MKRNKPKLNYDIRSIYYEVTRLLAARLYKIQQEDPSVDVEKVANDSGLSIIWLGGMGKEPAALDLETMTIALNEDMRELLETNRGTQKRFAIARQIGMLLICLGKLRV